MKREKYLLIWLILVLLNFSCAKNAINETTKPQDAIQNAFKKLLEAKFYHSVIKTQTGTNIGETEIFYSAPDKFWIKNQSKAKSEIIAIGNESFSKLNDGKWVRNSFDIAEMKTRMAELATSSMKDFEATGKENINGKNTFVYKFKSDYSGETTSKIWISADSGLPLKIETEAPIKNTLTVTIIYDFDKETPIESPKLN